MRQKARLSFKRHFFAQKSKNGLKNFCSISNYEARTKERIFKLGPWEKSLATPAIRLENSYLKSKMSYEGEGAGGWKVSHIFWVAPCEK